MSKNNETKQARVNQKGLLDSLIAFTAIRWESLTEDQKDEFCEWLNEFVEEETEC